MNKSVIRAALAAALGTVLATGCVGGSEAGPASSTAAPSTSESAHEPAHRPAQRQADVAFVRQMIPHHEGALAMARLVQGRTGNPAIVDLAGRVAQAQGPEIAQMKAWLRQWGVDQTETHGGTPGGTTHRARATRRCPAWARPTCASSSAPRAPSSIGCSCS
ncbi:DUF305 domain-containing protein [Prauserella oleivorans]